MASFHLRCFECAREFGEEPTRLVCPTCSQLQQPGMECRGVLECVIHELPRHWLSAASSRFGRFLPAATEDAADYSLPSGGTPLLATARLRQHLKTPHLWLKDESRNPSGSAKDRASELVVRKAESYGLSTVAVASTGNAATALAAHAAAAGLKAIAFVPGSAPLAKRVQIASYGAQVVAVEGTYDQSFELCRAACRRFGWYNRSTALNPFTLEGKKTAALEVAWQMRPDIPDVVLVPTGDGVILSGLAKGFRDLKSCQLIDRIPRLIAVQPEGASALVRAWQEGAESVARHVDASSVADSLTVEVPRNARQCLRDVRETGGSAIAVTDEAILEALRDLGRFAGVFAEPAAAASLAGLRLALQAGDIEAGERIVLMITGTGLKDIAAAAQVIPAAATIEPTLYALQAYMAHGDSIE